MGLILKFITDVYSPVRIGGYLSYLICISDAKIILSLVNNSNKYKFERC